ncbi:MAG: extracellular solute-binding protein [Deltaproteobacteria bacterium]|nr:MAG: extracellular solute-binding protein [Deltaproteobacteria bacterium]
MQRPLRVLSWAGVWGKALCDGVSRPFHEATGVAVEAVPHVGLRLPDALGRALEADREPPVDVVWCNTSPALRAARRGWCEPLDGAPVLRELADRARPPGVDGWPIAQTYVVHYVLVYRRAQYSAPPDSWHVLERAEHAGRIVLYPGGNGFYPVAQVMGGGRVSDLPRNLAPCWATVRRIRRQLATPSYSIGLSDVIRRGEIDLAYRALPNVLGFQADGLDVDWTAPREGIAETTDAMWIPRGLAPDVAACARAYISFALSARVQERWCEQLGALPLNRDARGRSRAFERSSLPRDPDDLTGILHIPEDIKATHEPEWEATFDRLCADRQTPRAGRSPGPS